MSEQIKDRSQRTRALDPTTSFIVQAPAGSGKTELLIQRLLRLLSTVEDPEEILAITFTRKAAAEMRSRILAAIQNAAEPEPIDAHAKVTWELAQIVLKNEPRWQLRQNPNRLRIQTIDSLCASLIKQMPILSQMGSIPAIQEDPEEIYRQAARMVLQLLDDNNEWQTAIANLLLHVDNNMQRAENLLANMLACREQWLPYLAFKDEAQLKIVLEKGLQLLAEHNLQQIKIHFPKHLSEQLNSGLQYALTQLNLYHDNILQLDEKFTTDFLPLWQNIARILLTQEGNWRRSLNKNQGFLSPSSSTCPKEKAKRTEYKERMLQLLTDLETQSEWASALADCCLLPDMQYNPAQWQMVAALIQVLPLLTAQCQLLFQQLGCCDYTEISQRALQALGTEAQPTDLALSLDYQIKHILVDEFQDTSQQQFRLLEQLVAGFTPHDGRTLFLVGDPMQSIYRFRKAEVGLFLKARAHGVGEVALTSLVLTSNFRASKSLVHWLNHTFKTVFPSQDDLTIGAIRYSQADAIKPETNTSATEYHLHIDGEQSQSDTVISLIRQAFANDPQQTIALLVQARTHLQQIIPALQQANIAYQATDIESMLEYPLIQDLLTLTQAVLFPADRLAWLALLRGPWCGLSLIDLHAIAYQKQTSTILSRLQALDTLTLSDEGKNRCRRLISVIVIALQQRAQQPIARTIAGIWFSLGGPATLNDHSLHQVANTFFQILNTCTLNSDRVDLNRLKRKLAKVSAEPLPNGAQQVQIMTIHKAKGLEFDTVIIPCLEKRSQIDETQLMLWQEILSEAQSALILAPIKHAQDEYDPIYRYLAKQEAQKNLYEKSRLFYVAATRAKQTLHLLASAKRDPSDPSELQQPSNSLLTLIWPAMRAQFIQSSSPEKIASPPVDRHSIWPVFTRLSLNWSPPQALSETFELQSSHPFLKKPFDKGHIAQQAIGTIAHRYLFRIANEGLEHWHPFKIHHQKNHIQNALMRFGLEKSETTAATEQIITALIHAMSDPKGRWILSPHKEAHSEYPITLVQSDEIVHLIIDRTFIDERGCRWLIDYKLSTPDNFESYRQQLNRYAKALNRLTAQEIQKALYFPLTKQWLPVDALC